MPDQPHFRLKFWGTRGSIACPGTENTRFGGNTSCIEIRCGEKLLVFDAGTGIRNLAKKLGSSDNLELDLFLTHTHFDHIHFLDDMGSSYSKVNRIDGSDPSK